MIQAAKSLDWNVMITKYPTLTDGSEKVHTERMVLIMSNLKTVPTK